MQVNNTPYGAGKAGSSSTPNIESDTTASLAKVTLVVGLSEGEVLGFGRSYTKDDIKKCVYLNSTPIKAEDGTDLLDVDVDFRNGTIDQSPLDGIASTAIETQINVTVTDSAPVSRSFTRKEVTQYDVRIGINALYENDDKGNSTARKLEFAIDIAGSDGSFSEYMKVSLHDKTTSGIQKTYSIKSESQSTRYIRVRRITPQANSQMIADALTVEAITEIIDIKPSYPHTAVLKLSFDAKAFSSMPQVAVLLHGKSDLLIPANYDPFARTYATTGVGTTNGLWNGEFKRGYSDNPVWHWLDVVTSPRYSLGQRLTLDNVDIYYLYRMAMYCDEMVSDGAGGQEPRFRSNNLYLQAATDARTVLKDIGAIFRAKQMYDGKHLSPQVDLPRDAKFNFSRANASDITYSSTASTARHNLIGVQYYDTSNQYKARYAYARSNDDIRRRQRIEQTTVQGTAIISEGQAQRQANYLLISELTETAILSFSTGMDGACPRIGDIILFSDEVVSGTKMSGRVVDIPPYKTIDDKGNVITSSATVVLDRELDATVMAGGTLYINTPDNVLMTRKITNFNGKTVTIDAPIDIDVTELVWACSSPNVAPLPYVVDNISYKADEFKWNITAIEYNPKKHTASDVSAAVNNTPATIITPLMPSAPATVTAVNNVTIEQGINVNNVVVSWTQASKAVKYALELSKDGSDFILIGVFTKLFYALPSLSNGVYLFRVRAYDALNNPSSYTTSNSISVAGKTSIPKSLMAFTATGILFGATFNWTYPANSEDSRAVRIQYSFSDPIKNASVVWTTIDIPYPSVATTLNGLSARIKLWARACIIDSYGIAGNYTSIVNTTTTADASQILEVIGGQIKQSDLNLALSQKIETTYNTASQANINVSFAQKQADEALSQAQKAQSDATSSLNKVAQEIKDRASAIASQADATTAQINKKGSDVLASANAETAKVKDGLTNETQARKDGDSSNASAITALQSSTDKQIATVVDKTNTLSTSVSSQANQISALQTKTDGTNAVLANNYSTTSDTNKAIASATTALETKLTKGIDANAKATSDLSTSVTNIDGKVQTQAGKITALSSSLDTTNSKLNTKADSSALSSYSTKTDTDNVVSTALNSFKSNLQVGSRNLVRYSRLQKGYLESDGSSAFSNVDMFDPNYYETFAGEKFVCTYFRQTSALSTGGMGIICWYDKDSKFLSYVVSHRLGEFVSTQIVAPASAKFFRYSIVGSNTEVQLERGNVPTDYHLANEDVSSGFDAQAQATQNVQANVTKLEGGVATQTTALNNLTSTVDANKKTAQTAIDGIQSSIKAQGDNISSTNNRVTALSSTLDNVGTAQKNTATALSNLGSTVTQQGKDIANNATNTTQLATKLDSIQVGGRNFINHSNFDFGWFLGKDSADPNATASQLGEGIVEIHGEALGFKQWQCDSRAVTGMDELTNGQTYTISVEIKATTADSIAQANDNSWVAVRENTSGSYPNKDVLKISKGSISTISTEWQRFSATATITTDDAHRLYWRFIIGFNGIGNVQFRRPKLEKGNVATDWSVSPLDFQAVDQANSSAIDTLNVKTDNTNGQVTAIANRTTALESRVSDEKTGNVALSNAINNTYTKAQSDSAISGAVNSYSASVGNLINYKITVISGNGKNGTIVDASGKKVYTAYRSYNLITLTADGLIDKTYSYDLYGNSSSETSRAVTDINALPAGTYVIVMTQDEPQRGANADFTAALVSLGASAVNINKIGYRNCYLLVGCKKFSEGMGNEIIRPAGNLIEYSLQLVNGVPLNLGTAVSIDTAQFAQASALSTLDAQVQKQNSDISSQSSQITTLNNTVTNMSVGGTNLIIQSALQKGWLNSANGQPQGASNAYDPNYYDTTAGQPYVFTYFTNNGNSTGGTGIICWYDKDKNYLTSTVTHTINNFISRYFVAPANATFYRYMLIHPSIKAKLEKGNVATDYSLSPDDINSADNANANAIATQATQITATSNALNTLTSKVNQQGSDLSSQSTQITTLSNSLSNLSVGGVNYILDSDYEYSLGDNYNNANQVASKLFFASSNINFNEFTTFTVSCEVYLEEGIFSDTSGAYSRVGLEVSIALSNNTTLYAQAFALPNRNTTINVNGRVSKTFVLGAGVFITKINSARILVRNLKANKVFARKPQLEYGNTPTAWKPAVEDGVSADVANANAISSLSSRVDTTNNNITATTNRTSALESKVNDSKTGNSALASSVSSLTTTVNNNQKSSVDSISTLTSKVNNNTASIQSQQTITDGLTARAVLRLESGNVIGGIGIENNGKQVDAIFRANTFAIVPPTNVKDQSPQNMFVYQSTPITTRNGSVIPAGLKVADAFIARIGAEKIDVSELSAITANLGSIKVKNANIEDGAITDAKIQNLSVDTIKIKDGAINNVFAGVFQLNSTRTLSHSSRSSFDLWGLEKIPSNTLVSIFFSGTISGSTETNIFESAGAPPILRVYIGNTYIGSCTGQFRSYTTGQSESFSETRWFDFNLESCIMRYASIDSTAPRNALGFIFDVTSNNNRNGKVTINFVECNVFINQVKK